MSVSWQDGKVWDAKKIKRASADTVKATTSSSIGGVPPFGHTREMSIYINEDLMQFDIVWAAASTSFAGFSIKPEDLVTNNNHKMVDLKKV